MKTKITPLTFLACVVSYSNHLLFPPKCVICNDLLYKSGELCNSCLESWNMARRSKCPVCNKTARACTCRMFSLDSTDKVGERSVSALVFLANPDSEEEKDMAVRRLIFSAKTAPAKDPLRLCARELSRDILKTLILAGEKARDWKITYPPRSRRRVLDYGFDQGRDLALLVSKYTGIPFEKTLVNRNGSTQKKLNAIERRNNATRSYCISNKAKIQGNYIIIDDVITTGATVNTCARLLKEAGAVRVYPACIARTKNKKRKVRRMADRPWFKST